jgi:crotonobetainyl-CoA:carnitine CoA-transferase CaiB-like acyl-CoA transferase
MRNILLPSQDLSVRALVGPFSTPTVWYVDSHITVARKLFVDVAYTKSSVSPHAGGHIKLSGTPAKVREPASQLGRHNDAVFGDLLELKPDRLAPLRRQGFF